jgi:hypothetical protein
LSDASGSTDRGEIPNVHWEAFAGLHEGRRNAHDVAMWQAPALTIAAQAFLLSVLTDPGLSDATRAFVLAAGSQPASQLCFR